MINGCLQSTVCTRLVAKVAFIPLILYGDKVVHLMAYEVTHISGAFSLVDHDSIKWVSLRDIWRWKLAPADIPLLDNIPS